MDTMTRAARSGRRWGVELGAPALIAAGFLLMALGVVEIGGLFTIGLGLVAIQVGCVILFATESRRSLFAEEEELMRRLEDL